MNDALINALGKLPVYSGISYRCLTGADPTPPSVFVTSGVTPATLAPSGFLKISGLRTVVAFLNRTARDASSFATDGPEAAILPNCAFRTVGEFEFPGPFTIRVVEEIVEPGFPEPAWPQDLAAILEQITTALADRATSGSMLRYAGPFAYIFTKGE